MRAAPDAAAIAAFLDGLSPCARLEAIAALHGPAIQRRLYRAVAVNPPLSLEDLVPEGVPPLREVVFCGKNSLPAFTRFQKRFCRAPQGARAPVWGYNHQSLAWLTGPGYFVVRPAPQAEHGTVVLDYREVPPRHPAGWPEVASNDGLFSRFIYGGTVDYLRRVSQHVLVGSAFRGGRERGNYFVLCREP